MKIYRVSSNVDKYQWLVPESESVWQGDLLEFDCKPKAASWTAPKVYVHNPKLPVGDFFNLAAGALVCGPRATEALHEHLEMAGELLPLALGSQGLTVMNVLECFNCLDDLRSENIGGANERYEFLPERLGGSSLFKIPQTSNAEILTVSGRPGKAPEEEFKSCVERHRLKGLEFELVWEQPQGSKPRRRRKAN